MLGSAMAKAHGRAGHRRALRPEDDRLLALPDLPPVDPGEQVGKGRGDEVDDVFIEGVLFREGGALPHGALRPVDVSPPSRRQRARVGRGVVLHLPRHRVVHRAPAHADRVGRADVGPGGHGRHVGRQRDQHPRGRRPRPRRGDVHRDGDPALEDRLHHLPHRGIEASRRVQLDHEERRVLLDRPVDDRGEVVRRDGADRRGDGGDEHPLRRGRGGKGGPRKSEEKRDRGEQNAANGTCHGSLFL